MIAVCNNVAADLVVCDWLRKSSKLNAFFTNYKPTTVLKWVKEKLDCIVYILLHIFTTATPEILNAKVENLSEEYHKKVD